MSYQKSLYFFRLYAQMKRDLHLTDKQMYEQFPCICEAKTQEAINNLNVQSKTTVNKIKRGIKL